MIGATYAIFTTSTAQEDTNTIETLECLELEFSNQKNVISLINTYPMTDERGSKNTPYTFTLTNNCGTYLEYSVGLAINGDNTLEDKYVKTIFTDAENTGEPVLLTDRIAGEVYNNKKTYIFRTDGLENNASKDYKLVLWVDGTASDSEIQKSFSGNIIINTKPIENKGQKTITVDLEDGNLLQELNEVYREGTKIKLPIPSKTGYKFDRWEVASGDAVIDENNYLTIGKENISLKAYYKEQYTLTVDLNGGKTTQSFEDYYDEKDEIILIAPTKTGSIFAGWEITSGNVVIDNNKLTFGTNNVSIKALWQQTWNFAFTGSEQILTAPYGGTYKLEIWGAQGGNAGSTNIGGYGGYSTGLYHFTKGEILYINVGGEGTSNITTSANGTIVRKDGGYNGGGGALIGTTAEKVGSGGGASHIATTSGLLSTLVESKEKIVIVAGGGGGSNTNGDGGAGGGISGNEGYSTGSEFAYGGGQQKPNGYINNYLFGQGQTESDTDESIAINNSSKEVYGSGGGGGYYGGESGGYGPQEVIRMVIMGGVYNTVTETYYPSGGGGGSGYIGNSLLTNKVMYCYNCTESSDESTKTISTTCTNETATTNCAKQGNGYAKITFISTN